MRRLYLVRHGEAKDASVDPERSLTPRGAEEVARVARLAIEQLKVRPNEVFHSGKTRARQSAEIWAELLGLEASQADGLAPNDDPDAWAWRVRTERADLMLVGHLPLLGLLASQLVVGSAEPSVVAFPTGGLVGLQRQGDAGWVVSLAVGPSPEGQP